MSIFADRILIRCWDGKNLDSPDHQSHMFNTVIDSAAPPQSFKNAGPCPASHPVRVPRVSLETLWDTTGFNNMWPADGKNPFVLSNGDGRGFGTHADYVFGWKGDSLQKAMDSNCNFNACENGRPLKSQGVQPMNACQVKDLVGEPNGDQCELSYILNLQGLSDATCVLGLSKLPGATV
jgi:hypothetical protein